MDFQPGVAQILPTARVPAAVARDAVHKNDAGPWRECGFPNADREPLPIAGRIEADSGERGGQRGDYAEQRIFDLLTFSPIHLLTHFHRSIARVGSCALLWSKNESLGESDNMLSEREVGQGACIYRNTEARPIERGRAAAVAKRDVLTGHEAAK